MDIKHNSDHEWTPDCSDKNSTHYFMCHMTQEDFEIRSNWSEMRKCSELQYHFNKIRMKELDKLI